MCVMSSRRPSQCTPCISRKSRRCDESERVWQAHALRLARLDEIVRCAFRFDSILEEPAAEDVEDLMSMLAVVPFDALLHDKDLLLNPAFGQTSQLVGGADADLIVGDMLVDIKATTSNTMQVGHLDQLLGYFFMGAVTAWMSRTSRPSTDWRSTSPDMATCGPGMQPPGRSTRSSLRPKNGSSTGLRKFSKHELWEEARQASTEPCQVCHWTRWTGI